MSTKLNLYNTATGELVKSYTLRESNGEADKAEQVQDDPFGHLDIREVEARRKQQRQISDKTTNLRFN